MRTLLAAATALLACVSTPASAYWVCYPISHPPVHHTHHVARHIIGRPTLRHHHHHRRFCHAHVHCVWVDDAGGGGGGLGSDVDSGFYGGYSEGSEGSEAASGEGEGDAGAWFPLGGLGGLPDATTPIAFTPYLPFDCTPPYTIVTEYSPCPPQIPQVPETSTYAMMGIGFAFLFGLGSKRRLALARSVD